VGAVGKERRDHILTERNALEGIVSASRYEAITVGASEQNLIFREFVVAWAVVFLGYRDRGVKADTTVLETR